MINTYRKWKNNWVTFFIESYDETDEVYYCVEPYYWDNWFYQYDFLKENSIEATILDKIKFYLITKTIWRD